MEIFTGNIGNTHKTVLLQVWRKYISLHICGNFDPSEHPDSPRINSWTRGLKISCRFLLDCTISILERNLLIYIYIYSSRRLRCNLKIALKIAKEHHSKPSILWENMLILGVLPILGVLYVCIYIYISSINQSYLSWAKTAGLMKVNEIFVCCFFRSWLFWWLVNHIDWVEYVSQHVKQQKAA